MKYCVYSMRDLKSSFTSLMTDLHDAAALRNFTHAINSNEFYKQFASDFQLFKIAEFDNSTGVITPVDPIQLIADGPSVVDIRERVGDE